MITIGLLGYGTVGQGLYKIIQDRKEEFRQALGEDIQIKKILVRTLEKEREIKVPFEKLTLDSREIIEDEEIDVIVEVTGDVSLSYRLIKEAFRKKKHVVTANKAVVSAYFEELSQLAEEKEVYFLYEASVAGGIPVIKPLKDQVRLNSIHKIQGILNGTCNYILTRMTEEGLTFADVLKEAQRLGYAEMDPSSDVDGIDTMRKIRILSSIALGSSTKESDIICQGIRNITAVDIDFMLNRGRVIKLIGEALEKEDGFEAIVQPKAFEMKNGFSKVNGADNKVIYEGNYSGILEFEGPGAGMYPTANAVMTDVIDCVLKLQPCKSPLKQKKLMNRNDEIKGRYYIRISKDGASLQISEELIEDKLIDNERIYAIETKIVKREDLLSLLSGLHPDTYALIALEE